MITTFSTLPTLECISNLLTNVENVENAMIYKIFFSTKIACP
jgi:hypothetical protein